MKNMNALNQNIPLVRIAALVAACAAVLVSVNVVLTASVVCCAGMLALLVGDYGREIPPVRAEPVPAPVVPLRRELDLAA
jgi:hypothetical protein